MVSELRQLRGQGVFQPYRAPSWAGGEKAADGVGKTSTDRGKWNMCAPPNPEVEHVRVGQLFSRLLTLVCCCW